MEKHEVSVAKLKSDHGFRFIKELGGAVNRRTVSFAANWLVNGSLVTGRVLDYGCGFGFDAEHFGWEAFDPYYRQAAPKGHFDTIVCNHVLNMLTRTSRTEVINNILRLLSGEGVAWLIVPRNIPRTGKIAMRQRIQNYVQLELPSEYRDDKLEIYRMTSAQIVKDRTNEVERWLSRSRKRN